MFDNLTTSSPYEALDPKQGVILGVITTPGVIANVLTIIVTLRLLKHQKMTPNVFVFALACTDLSAIVLVCFPTFLCYAFNEWVGGEQMCKFQGFLTLFFSLGSGFLATTMSIDRFMAVRWPLYHRQHVTVQVVQRIVLVMLMLSALVSFFPVLGFGAFVRNLTGTYCTLNWFAKAAEDIAFSCLFASLGFLLIITVIFCNINVVWKLYRRREKIRSMVSYKSGIKEDKNSSALDKQFAKMMIVISVIFLLCWTPFTVRTICNISGVWKSWSADLQSSRLLLLNFVLDPFTYVLTRKHYRRALRAMICGWRKKKTSLTVNSSLTSSSRNLRSTRVTDVTLHDVTKCSNQGRDESVDNSIDNTETVPTNKLFEQITDKNT